MRARAVSADRRADLELAFGRLGLGASERERLAGQLAHLQLLLTGLEEAHLALLQALLAPPPAGAPPLLVQGSAPGTALLSLRRSQLEALEAQVRAAPGGEAMAHALAAVLAAARPPASLTLGGRTFTFGERTHVMGVVNVTPDSFSDGGRFLTPEAARAHGLALVAAGAEVLDIGGESSRPGAPRVEAGEELARILPVLRALREATDVPLSVDTTKAAVAREALRAGAVLVNDISGLHFDPALPRVVAEAGAACCLMHIQGTPATMQQRPAYADVVDEVLAWLEEGLSRAVAAGVARERLLVDPGIGFGKTAGHNLLLLRRLGDLRALGRPILVGTSRKAFLGALAGGKLPGERLPATLGSVAAVAVLGGADFVRVHDVAEARDALAVADAVRRAQEAGSLFFPAFPAPTPDAG